MPRSSTNELELILDKQPTECPALIKERLIETQTAESLFETARIGKDYSWLVSQSSLFIWRQKRDLTASNALILPLPPTGLDYDANAILVFQNGKKLGVIAVSREGIARMWPSMESSNFMDADLDINQEVVLSVSLIKGAKSPFLLSTTSGSVYLLEYSKAGVVAEKIHGGTSQGIRRRLSAMLFGPGSSAPSGARAISSLLLHSDDRPGISGTVAVTVSTNAIHAVDLQDRKVLWTFENSAIAQQLENSLSRVLRNQKISKLRSWFLDAAEYRDGLLVLVASAHSRSSHISLFLVHISEFDQNEPVIGWYSMVPLSNAAASYLIVDKDSFLGRLRLSIPKSTSNSDASEQTDGIFIIHPNFVQSIYTPDDLQKIGELPLNKVHVLKDEVRIIGHTCNNRYCSIMLSDGTFSDLRLLPKGFGDDSYMDTSLLELPDMNLDDEVLGCFRDSFQSFIEKDLVQASVTIKLVSSKAPAELLSAVYDFLSTFVDATDSDAVTQSELKNKRHLIRKFIVYLKHINLLDSLVAASVSVANPTKICRTGASILSEMTERVEVALALHSWNTDINHSQALDFICQEIARQNGFRGDADSLIMGKLLLLHNVPEATVECARRLLSNEGDTINRQQLLDLSAELLLSFAEAIEISRRSTHSVLVPEEDRKWTHGPVAQGFQDLALLLLDEVKSEKLSLADRINFINKAVRLAVFNLSETDEQPDGHPVLLSLYDIENDGVTKAVELAERFKDFKVLCLFCMDYGENAERKSRMDSYKKRFASNDFDMYLFQFLKRRGLEEELLAQKGERADKFLSTVGGLRWRRELQNHQYLEASESLTSLGIQEENDVFKQKTLLSLAKLAALCADHIDQEAICDIDDRLDIINFQMDIPSNLLRFIYPENENRPLTVTEMIAINRTGYESLNTGELDSFVRALDLLSALRLQSDQQSFTEEVLNVWVAAFIQTDWKKVSSSNQFECSLLAELVTAIGNSEWDDIRKSFALPDGRKLFSIDDVRKVASKKPDAEKLTKMKLELLNRELGSC